MSGRAPIDVDGLRTLLDDCPWRDLRWVAETGSTNADVAALAHRGADEGLVLAADLQTAGRGRLDRRWESPPGAGIAVSVLLRPTRVPRARWSWLPLLTGAAVADALDATGVRIGLKWPNDLLVGDRKLGGILVEAVAGAEAVVVGIGINVSTTSAELPSDAATSLLLEGVRELDRTRLLARIVDGLATAYGRWCAVAGDPADLRRAYVSRCVTLGRDVRLHLPSGDAPVGRALDVDDDGRLVVDLGDRTLAVAAGEVVHVR